MVSNRWYNKAGDITKQFWEKTIQFYGSFYGLKITTCKDRARICRFLNTIYCTKIWGRMGVYLKVGLILKPKMHYETGMLIFSKLDWLVLIKCRICKQYNQSLIKNWKKLNLEESLCFRDFVVIWCYLFIIFYIQYFNN